MSRSRSLHYVFPAGNSQDVCLTQVTAGAQNLLFNGNLANSIDSQVSFISYGYSRSISITSIANLAAVNFTITGFQNGVAVSEVLAGPNNTTIYGAVIYDVITSITASGATGVNGVSIGTGYLGFFPLIGINLEKDILNYSLSTAAETVGTINTTIYGTLNNIVNSKTYLDWTATQNLFGIKDTSADDQYLLQSLLANGGGDVYVLNTLWRFILIEITGTALTIANSVSMQFIQL